MKFWSFSKFTD